MGILTKHMGNVNFTGVLKCCLNWKNAMWRTFKKKILRIYRKYPGLMIKVIWKINQVEFYVTDRKKMKSWKGQMYISFEKLQCTLCVVQYFSKVIYNLVYSVFLLWGVKNWERDGRFREVSKEMIPLLSSNGIF